MQPSEQPRRTLAGMTAEKPNEIRQQSGPTIVLMGPQGGGKTSLLYTLTEAKDPAMMLPLAVIDTGSGGAHVLPTHPMIDVYRPTTWAQLERIEQDIAKGTSPYKSIAWDLLTEVQMISHEHAQVYETENPQVRMSRYGNSNQETLELARKLATHSANQGINVIFVAWAETIKEQGIDRTVMDLTPTFRRQLTGVVDFIVYVEPMPPPKPYPPVMRTGGSLNYGTRTRVAPDSPMLKVPELVYQPSLATLIETFHNGEWPADQHTRKLTTP